MSGYAPPEKQPPFGPYLAFMSIFASLVGAALAVARRSDRELPAKVDPGQLLLVGTASHKLSRLIAKDKVTSPLRAPFTELEGKGGPAELEETSRGTGLRTVSATSTMSWSPSASATDLAGGAASVVPVSELGVLDREF